MNARQKALLEYVKTIAPHTVGARSVDDFMGRMIGCVREDVAFIATGFASAAVHKGRQFVDNKTNDAVGMVVGLIGSFISAKSKPKKRH
jgi:hypothetical protein